MATFRAVPASTCGHCPQVLRFTIVWDTPGKEKVAKWSSAPASILEGFNEIYVVYGPPKPYKTGEKTPKLPNRPVFAPLQGGLPKGWYIRMFPWNENRNEGSFRWVPDSCHREGGKCSRELSKIVRGGGQDWILIPPGTKPIHAGKDIWGIHFRVNTCACVRSRTNTGKCSEECLSANCQNEFRCEYMSCLYSHPHGYRTTFWRSVYV